MTKYSRFDNCSFFTQFWKYIKYIFTYDISKINSEKSHGDNFSYTFIAKTVTKGLVIFNYEIQYCRVISLTLNLSTRYLTSVRSH